MKYKGSCHCGNIRFEVEGDLDNVMDCNCSFCSKRGSLMWFVPRQQMHLKTPEENMSTYQFGAHTIKHHFCPKCGCAPFGEGTDRGGNAMAAVNARCLEEVEVSELTVTPFDGRSL